MDPATILLILKALLTAIPALTQEARILAERGEYSEAEWQAVKDMIAKAKTDPAWQEEPDPPTSRKTTTTT